MDRKELENVDKTTLIEIILALTEEMAELERQLNQNSSNSSNPPGSDKWKQCVSRKSTGGNPGGQGGHKGNFIKTEREADEVTGIKPSKCRKSGEDLSGRTGSVRESRPKIDVEIKTKITRYEQYEAECPCCGNVKREDFPVDVKRHISYGEGVQWIGVLLRNYAKVSYDKTQKIMNDVFGVRVSVGTVVKHSKEIADKSEGVLVEIANNVKQGEIGHFDETSIRINGKNQWLHTASNVQYRTPNQRNFRY
jgi:hypothetical protein